MDSTCVAVRNAFSHEENESEGASTWRTEPAGQFLWLSGQKSLPRHPRRHLHHLCFVPDVLLLPPISISTILIVSFWKGCFCVNTTSQSSLEYCSAAIYRTAKQTTWADLGVWVLMPAIIQRTTSSSVSVQLAEPLWFGAPGGPRGPRCFSAASLSGSRSFRHHFKWNTSKCPVSPFCLLVLFRWEPSSARRRVCVVFCFC